MNCRLLVIDLWAPVAECILCGVEDYMKNLHYVPMFEGVIVSNDYESEWAGMPICKKCYEGGCYV